MHSKKNYHHVTFRFPEHQNLRISLKKLQLSPQTSYTGLCSRPHYGTFWSPVVEIPNALLTVTGNV